MGPDPVLQWCNVMKPISRFCNLASPGAWVHWNSDAFYVKIHQYVPLTAIWIVFLNYCSNNLCLLAGLFKYDLGWAACLLSSFTSKIPSIRKSAPTSSAWNLRNFQAPLLQSSDFATLWWVSHNFGLSGSIRYGTLSSIIKSFIHCRYSATGYKISHWWDWNKIAVG